MKKGIVTAATADDTTISHAIDDRRLLAATARRGAAATIRARSTAHPAAR